MDASRSLSDPEDRGYLLLAYGRVAMYRGDYPRAIDRLREGIALLDAANRSGRQGWGLCVLAESLTLTGDLPGAEQALAEADHAAAPSNPLYQADAQRARAWSLVGQGLVSAAVAALLEVAAAQRGRAPVNELYALHDVVRLGEASAAADRIGTIAETVDGRAADVFSAHARAAQARDAQAFDEVSAAFEAMGARLFAAEAAANAAALHRARGARGAASLSAARSAQLALGTAASTPALELLEEQHGLTRREREVAT
jgi:hypothetical protein